MIVPSRSATTKRKSRSSAGTSSGEHEQLAELDADVEREQRRQQVRAGELQRLPQREREAEAVHEAEPERDQPAAVQRSAPTMFSSAM